MKLNEEPDLQATGQAESPWGVLWFLNVDLPVQPGGITVSSASGRTSTFFATIGSGLFFTREVQLSTSMSTSLSLAALVTAKLPTGCDVLECIPSSTVLQMYIYPGNTF